MAGKGGIVDWIKQLKLSEPEVKLLQATSSYKERWFNKKLWNSRIFAKSSCLLCCC